MKRKQTTSKESRSSERNDINALADRQIIPNTVTDPETDRVPPALTASTASRFDSFLPFKIEEPKSTRFVLIQFCDDGEYAYVNRCAVPAQGDPVAVAVPDERGKFIIEAFDGQQKILGVVTPLVSMIKEPKRVAQAEEPLFPSLIDA